MNATNSKARNYPVRGNAYSLREVLEQLHLDDSPSLMFKVAGSDVYSVLQNVHLTQEELLSVAGFADTKWTYIRTTHEWIPIFHYCEPNNPITNFVDIEPEVDFNGRECTDKWVTPKGFPLEQYYKRSATSKE